MRKRFFSGGLLTVAVTFLCLTGCNKPKPNAPTQDFASRHQCPVKTVESAKEGSDRMRVTGCGESELYVRSCENNRAAVPASESRQPVTEAEAKFSSPAHPPFSEPGCAWARQKPLAPSAGSAAQPKWLSAP